MVYRYRSNLKKAILTDIDLYHLIERMTRQFLMIQVPGRSPIGVMEALSKLRSECS